MATERQSPDALLENTGLTGTVSAIQDDPDSPDGSWLTTASNTATVARVSFPTPTGNPTVGAGVQEFRVLVRKTNQSTNPTCTVALYENNTSLATIVSSTTISTTAGIVLSGTWNANLLSTADGSLVECRVVGTVGGGTPSNRASVEVGAIEWNVVYDVPVSSARGYAQAQADIKAVGQGYAQSNADIKATSYGLAQSQADILQTYNQWAQAQAKIATAGGGGGALAVVQTNSGVATTGNPSTASWTPTDGNLLIAGVLTRSTGITASLSGNGQTWNAAPHGDKAGDRAQDRLQVFYCIASSSSAGTITATLTGNVNPASILAIEISGADSIEADSITGTGGTDNANLSGSVTTLTDNAWIVGVLQQRVRTITLDGSLTSDIEDIDSGGPAGSNIIGTIAHKAVSPAGSATVSGTLNNTADWVVWTAAIKPSAGGPPTPTTRYAFAQAQADIKQIGQGFAQANSDIKATSNGYGQTQADIKATSRGYGQSQADIKATSRGYGQSQADIKATSRGYGQTQADIKAVGYGLGQALAQIKGAIQVFGQAQADIRAIGRAFAQAMADIKAVGRGSGQSQARIVQTARGYGQAQADVKAVSVGSGQAQADIKAVARGFGQSLADIKALGRGFGQSNALIFRTARGFAQSQALIKTIVVVTGQAQALIKTTTRHFGQALAVIVRTHQVFGQARTFLAVGPDIHLKLTDRHSTTIEFVDDSIHLTLLSRGLLLTLTDREGE